MLTNSEQTSVTLLCVLAQKKRSRYCVKIFTKIRGKGRRRCWWTKKSRI